MNDRLAGIPLAVTYCPLCDSAAVFDRRIGDREVEFGISGLLYNSNVLLYDRGSEGEESLWSQMMAESVTGPHVGNKLRTLPVEVTTWEDWVRRHPGTQVLSTETGHQRDYSRSPYAGYFQSDELMFPAPQDGRLPPKARLLGVWTDEAARAYPLAAFESPGDSQELSQEIAGRQFKLAYNLEAESLRIVEADEGVNWMYSLWFAWYAFHRETEVFEASDQIK